MNTELQRAVLREEINITRSMLDLGYYPYTIKFDASGHVEIVARPSRDSDREKFLGEAIEKLSALEATACQAFYSRCPKRGCLKRRGQEEEEG